MIEEDYYGSFANRIHESGHAVESLVLGYGCVIDMRVIGDSVPHCDTYGVGSFSKEGKLKIAMAGAYAEFIFGDTGKDIIFIQNKHAGTDTKYVGEALDELNIKASRARRRKFIKTMNIVAMDLITYKSMLYHITDRLERIDILNLRIDR